MNRCQVTFILSFLILFSPAFGYTQETGASNFLYEYGVSLYQKGNIYDAIHQLKNALLVNPRNWRALNFLNKIFKELQDEAKTHYLDLNQEKIKQLSSKIEQLQKEKELYQRQLASLKNVPLEKEKEFARLSQQLKEQKELLERERQRINQSWQESLKEIESLKIQIARLQEKESNYLKQLDILRKSTIDKDDRIEELKKDLRLSEEQRLKQLKEKEEALNKIKEFYEDRVSAINAALEKKTYDAQAASEKAKSILVEVRKRQLAKIAQIDGIMHKIKEVVPELAALEDTAGVSKVDKEVRRRQIERIRQIMRKIEEVLPRQE